jgi:hypothetical protein
MCKQIEKYGCEATIKSEMLLTGEHFAVFRDPQTLVYPVYQRKGYKSGDFL